MILLLAFAHLLEIFGDGVKGNPGMMELNAFQSGLVKHGILANLHGWKDGQQQHSFDVTLLLAQTARWS